LSRVQICRAQFEKWDEVGINASVSLSALQRCVGRLQCTIRARSVVHGIVAFVRDLGSGGDISNFETRAALQINRHQGTAGVQSEPKRPRRRCVRCCCCTYPLTIGADIEAPERWFTVTTHSGKRSRSAERSRSADDGSD
jgi:hypothetical protein